MKKRNKPVIPGFGLSMGITISILSLVVLIPLASLVVYTAKLSFKDFIETITRARVLVSFYTSFVCAFAAAVINGIMGTVLAWVLVKYDFPGRRLMDGMIELPFALPTAVAGIALTSLTSDSGIVGSFFAGFGIKIAYTRIGITVAMIFVGIPFVVRSVQPVLEKMDNSYSEAAGVLGAKKTTIFWKVIFPNRSPRSLREPDLRSEDVWVNMEVLYLSQEINPIIQKSHRWLLCQSFRNLIIQVQRQSHL